MDRVVTVIEARPKPKFLNDGTAILPTQKRAVAYCRVSTMNEEQKTSYDNQIEEWTNRLKNDPKLIYVGIYADHGLSGTRAENRVELNKMIADAKAGKFDIIYTKSVSRMARNTADSINIARELKEYGVEIYFDEEHISSLDPKNEVMFTLSAAMAQEESRHISENIRWTLAKKMKEGHAFLTDSKFLGYRKDPDNPKNLIVVPEEAKVVKLIYELYIGGMGTNAICREMEKRGILTGAKKTKWYSSTIESIIKNEKYCGDLLLQKFVTLDYLTHRRVKNDGHSPQYFVKDNHEAIIDRETWEKAQLILQRNKDKFCGVNKNMNKYTYRYPFSGLLMCIHCGNTYKRRQWTQGYPEPRIVYQCTNYIEGDPGDRCEGKPISEEIVQKTLCEVINKIFVKDSTIFSRIYELITKHIEEDASLDEMDTLLEKQRQIDKEIDLIFSQKAIASTDDERVMLDRKYRAKIEEYKGITNQIEELQIKQKNNEYNVLRLEEMKKALSIKELTPELLTKQIVDAFIAKVIIINRKEIVICLNGNNQFDAKYIKENRKAIVKQKSILDGEVDLPRPFRPEHLHYKVVLL